MGAYSSSGRRFTPQEKERQSQALFLLMEAIDARPVCPLTTEALQTWHRQLSGDIPDFLPGIYRPGEITFGSYFGVHPAKIEANMDLWQADLQSQYTEIQEWASYDWLDEEQARLRGLQLALWAHAELIRIHPFQDGNGRLSRAVLLNVALWFDLQPPAFMNRSAYFAALGKYVLEQDLRPLIHLTLQEN